MPAYLPGVGVTLSPDFIDTGMDLRSSSISADVDLDGDFTGVVIGVFPDRPSSTSIKVFHLLVTPMPGIYETNLPSDKVGGNVFALITPVR